MTGSGRALRTTLLYTIAGLAVASPNRGAARAETEPASRLLFGTLEASPSTFLTGGAKLALDRIDRQGFVGLATLGAGTRREGTSRRDTATGAAVFGYQWFRDWGVIAAYAGVEGSLTALTAGSVTRLDPIRVGARLQGEIWARPGEATLLTATAILDTSRTAAWGRLSWGWRVEPCSGWSAYLGPELALYVDRTGYRKWNLGLHATDFTLGRFSLRSSVGLQFEPQGQPAPYVSLTAWTPW